ncbi:Sua5/YciO/YrdC/YwlC family protein [Mesomycoplasma moatsii]|uniref:Sua5/YciO/YrdC/YwlC family protein n=1 Tax=Mesomycoplasma moatsii TaxID=171287 RepID=UPI00041487E2
MKLLKDYDVFIVTTDTVLGIGGKVNDKVKNKIYKLKKRDLSKKLIIVVSSIEQLKKIENINKIHLEYINKYWPGNVTLIINDNAYRMPNNKELLKFIENEGPFYLSSANISNESIIKDINEAKKIFPNLKYFDFGKGSGTPSIIIDTKTGMRLR